ncbi:hypothetical protein PPERSA_12710 [Pseudocohnilembus persalinus]|uniref:SIN1-type PH domain-containing protein n=1 Tax=Pseudocohnilembus persalinus TaxID=266149 RepID=A0A0V0QT93_PSEPJ|nr:hypothetical protein PPERSA_12710 [Pseudocohnilembus persalinus]|eukprot:KRX05532.1 hypothetical protein PPERSA_12710 [Pseudocohnilembus persalinus]
MSEVNTLAEKQLEKENINFANESKQRHKQSLSNKQRSFKKKSETLSDNNNSSNNINILNLSSTQNSQLSTQQQDSILKNISNNSEKQKQQQLKQNEQQEELQSQQTQLRQKKSSQASTQQKQKSSLKNEKEREKQRISKKQIQEDVKNIINTYAKNCLGATGFTDEDEQEDDDESDSDIEDDDEFFDDDDEYDNMEQVENQQEQQQKQQENSQQRNVDKDGDDEQQDDSLKQQSVFEKKSLQPIKQNKRSLFSTNLSQGRSQSAVQKSNFKQINNPNMRKIKVFLLGTPKFLNVFVLRTIKIKELIDIIIQEYKDNKDLDQNLLKYPEYPQAYELRILDDGDGYEPDLSIPPNSDLNTNISVLEDTVVFMQNESFQSPNRSSVAQSFIPQEFEKIEMSKKTQIFQVEIIDDNFKSMIAAQQNDTIEDIFKQLQKKNPKISSKSYIPKAYDKNNQLQELDVSYPVNLLTNNTIQLHRRNFADNPIEDIGQCQSFVQGLIQEQISNTYNNHGSFEQSDNQGPLNIIQASKYEEFPVIKINKRGKRQDRTLGINQYKIFNMSSKLVNGQNPGFMDSLFKSKSVKRQERLISEVMNITYMQPKSVHMLVKDGNSTKKLNFEAKSGTDAKKIVNKIQYLMEQNAKQQM